MKKNMFRILSTLLILATIFTLSSCSIFTNSTEKEINRLLKDDLNDSIKITKLYYNEEKQGCFVEFQTSTYTDKAAVHLDTGAIDYESEFDYYTEKAEELRNQNPINQEELHKCNQEILNSSYADWHFAIVVFEANGRPEDSSWKRIK